MRIKPTDLVLEIGSGDNPHPRADILCDRYITTSHERAGGFRVRIDRPMVVVDGMRLPFADKTFDYVITSHIFEHMDDPLGFAREIMRVGKAGFIEVPSALSERVFGWDFHHWYLTIQNGVLTCTPKKEGERPPAGEAGWDGFFHRFIARNLWFRRFFEEHEEVWYVRLEWRERIPIRMNMRPMDNDETGELDEKAWKLLENAKPELRKDVLFAVRFFFRRVSRKARKIVRGVVWMLTKRTPEYCVCPDCHATLRADGGALICMRCDTRFSVEGVIPILLVPEERKMGY